MGQPPSTPKEVFMRLAHSAVLIVLLLLVPLAAVAAEHVVIVRDFEFSPSELTIQKNDVVRWVWESGAQTVTDGDPEEPSEAGLRFDGIVNAQNHEFTRTFGETGDFPYFSWTDTGVKGAISVVEGTPVDRATWGWIKQVFENTSSARNRR
jgi:plastocyanin